MGGKIIDGTGGEPIANGVVVIDRNTITDVGSRSDISIPAGARIIDANGASVLPALADLHTHSAHYTVTTNWYVDDLGGLESQFIAQ